MKLSWVSSTVPAWSLAFLIGGMRILNLMFPPDFLAGLRIPLFCCLVIACHLPLLKLRRIKNVDSDIIIKLTIATAIVFGISVAYADNSTYGMWKFGVFLCMSVVPSLLIIRFYQGRNELLRNFLGGLLLFSIISLIQLAFEIQVFGIYGIRWHLLNSKADIIGISRILGIGAILLFGHLLRRQNILNRIIAYVLFILMIIGQIILQQRGPLLSCLFSILVFAIVGFWNSPLRMRMKGFATMLFLTLPIICFFSFLPVMGQRFNINGTFPETRVDIIKAAQETIQRMSWIAGEGLGNFSYYGYSGQIRQYPHNIFIEVFLETGIIGLTVLSLYGFAVLRLTFLRTVKEGTSPFSYINESRTLVVFAFLNAQVSGDIGTNYMLWVFCSLAVCSIASLDYKNRKRFLDKNFKSSYGKIKNKN